MRRPWVIPLVVVAGCTHGATRGPDPARLATRIHRSDNPVFQGALLQLEHPARYDDRYVRITYPGGDVPQETGACADVVVRALRHAGFDLQKLIHEDAKSGAYPHIKTTDPCIDHRRVLNQEVFLRRHGQVLSTVVSAKTLDQWKPGDIVSWRLFYDRPHVGVVSDTKGPDGVPYVIHNVGVVSEEDVLTAWRIAGHFRFPAESHRR